MPWQRWWLAAAGSLLLGLLAAAAFLEPSPTGVGTHQQLGLPPCSFRVTMGFPCPACGMTTSWSHFVRGQFVQAAAANVGGTLLAMAAAWCGPWSLISGVRGRCLWGVPNQRLVLAGSVSLIIVTCVDWIIRLLIS